MENPTVSAVKKLPAIFTALTIILGTLIVSSIVNYSYINPKLFTIEAGLTIVIALVLLLYPFGVWKKVIKLPIVWGIKLFLLVTIVSSLFSIDRTTSWFGSVDRGTSTFFLIILTTAACAIGTVLNKAQARKYILVPISITAAVLAISTYIGKAATWSILKTAGIGGFVGNSSIAGTYLLMAFFITAYLLLSEQTRWAKVLYGVALACIVINPVFLNTSFFGSGPHTVFSLVGDAKGATLSVFFGIVVTVSTWFILSKKRTYKIIGSIILGLALLATAFGIVSLSTQNTTIHNWFVKQETDVRFVYWNIALKGFKAHPIVGTGPETYSYTYQTYFDPIVMLPSHSGEIWSNKPHNNYLQVLSETGLLGAIGYIALWLGIAISLVRLYRYDRDKKFFVAMVGLFAAYMLNNLIFFDTLTSYLVLFMIVAYIIAATPYTHIATLNPVWQKIVRYVLAIGVVAVVGIIIIPQLIKTYRAYEEFLLPLDQRTTWYQKVEDTSSYGSGLFLAQRADFTYQSVYYANLQSILQQNSTNKIIAANSIQGLINTLQNSAQRYPPNEQEELSIGRLASIKMVILNGPDTASLTTMKNAGEAAIAISPTNPSAYLLLGQEEVYEQKYDAAYTTFEQARALEPALIQSQLALINLATILHDTSKAALFTARAKQESPDFAAAFK